MPEQGLEELVMQLAQEVDRLKERLGMKEAIPTLRTRYLDFIARRPERRSEEE